jgi:hypothetical protein
MYFSPSVITGISAGSLVVLGALFALFRAMQNPANPAEGSEHGDGVEATPADESDANEEATSEHGDGVEAAPADESDANEEATSEHSDGVERDIFMLASSEPITYPKEDPILLQNIVYTVQLGPHQYDRISLLQAYLFQGGNSTSDATLLRSVAQLASTLKDGGEVMVQSPLNRQSYPTNFFADESNPEPLLPGEDGATYLDPFAGKSKLIAALIAHDLISDRALAEYCRRNTLSDLPDDFFNSFEILSIDKILGVLFVFGFVDTLSEIISKSSSYENKTLDAAQAFLSTLAYFPNFDLIMEEYKDKKGVEVLNQTLRLSFQQSDYKRHAKTIFSWLCTQATRNLPLYQRFFNVCCVQELRKMRRTDLLLCLLQHAKNAFPFMEVVENSMRKEWGEDSFAHFMVSLYEAGQDQKLLTLLYDLNCSTFHRQQTQTKNIVHYAGLIYNFDALKWLRQKNRFQRFFFERGSNEETLIHLISGGRWHVPKGALQPVDPEQHHADKQKEARSFLTWCTHAFGGLLRALFRKRDNSGKYAPFQTIWNDNVSVLSWFAESGGFFEKSITDHGPVIAEAAAYRGSVACLDFLLQRSKQTPRFCLLDPYAESRPYQALFDGKNQSLWDKAGEGHPEAKAAVHACLATHGMKPS